MIAVKLSRTEDGDAVVEGVEHKMKHHSPSGFEFGYGGSGPADLAYNILLKYVKNMDVINTKYQQFKWDVVAAIPETGGVITVETIRDWVKVNIPEVDVDTLTWG